ncbi:XRE family transcriptional regulator [Gemmiger formicilis]|uniref:XRE family transcriptional regulator n=1 Tax=Gemmiger formicilis TaxID=745368 RepID=UPI003999E354
MIMNRFSRIEITILFPNQIGNQFVSKNTFGINNIENKKSLPAMQSFFYICEYLGVTPQEFFDEGNTYPETLKEFIAEARQLDPQSMQYILGIMKELNSRK